MATKAKEALTEQDLGGILRRTTMLVLFTRSMWSGRANDSRAVEDVKSANNAQGDIGGFQKNLLAGADKELKAIGSLMKLAYNEHRRLTLPFSMEALRLLPLTRMPRYLQVMGEFTGKLQPLVDDFVQKYDTVLVPSAKAHLGHLFDPHQYPSGHEIRDRFAMNWQLTPVPAGTDWRELPANDQLLLALQQHTKENLKKAMGTALDELRQRVVDWIARADKALPDHDDDPSKPAIAFHGTFVEDLHRLAQDLREMNVGDEPEFKKLAEMMEEAGSYAGPKENIDSFKGNPQLRAAVLEVARRMEKCMADYQEERDANA